MLENTQITHSSCIYVSLAFTDCKKHSYIQFLLSNESLLYRSSEKQIKYKRIPVTRQLKPWGKNLK